LYAPGAVAGTPKGLSEAGAWGASGRPAALAEGSARSARAKARMPTADLLPSIDIFGPWLPILRLSLPASTSVRGLAGDLASVQQPPWQEIPPAADTFWCLTRPRILVTVENVSHRVAIITMATIPRAMPRRCFDIFRNREADAGMRPDNGCVTARGLMSVHRKMKERREETAALDTRTRQTCRYGDAARSRLAGHLESDDARKRWNKRRFMLLRTGLAMANENFAVSRAKRGSSREHWWGEGCDVWKAKGSVCGRGCETERRTDWRRLFCCSCGGVHLVWSTWDMRGESGQVLKGRARAMVV